MIWILAKASVVLIGIVLIIGFTVFADVHRARKQQRKPAAPGTVARHRAGDDRKEKPGNWSPLRDDTRRFLASTHHDPDVFLPSQGPAEDTRPLIPPRRNHPMGGTR